MIRTALVILSFIVLYQALKTVFRSAVRAYRDDDGRPGLRGEELVQDPQCGTYVVKGRAVSRRVRGATAYFCSDECAGRFERKQQ